MEKQDGDTDTESKSNRFEDFPVAQLSNKIYKPLKNGYQDYEYDAKSRRMICLSTDSMGFRKNQIELVRDGRLLSRIELPDQILKRNGIENMNGISFGSQKKAFIAGGNSIYVLDLTSLVRHCNLKRPISLNQNQTNIITKNKLFTGRADRVRVGLCQQLLVYSTTTHLQVINCKTQKIVRNVPISNLPYSSTQVFLERQNRRLILIANWPGTPKPHGQMKLLLFDIKTSKLINFLDVNMSEISPNVEKINRGFFLNALFHNRKIFLSIDFFEEPSFIRPTIVEIDFHFNSPEPGYQDRTAVITNISSRAIHQANTFLEILDYVEEDNLLVLKDIESKRIHFSLADNHFEKQTTPI